MKIFGKSFSEYVRFESIILWLILIVGIGRLALSLEGVSNSGARWVSITAVTFIGLVYVSIRVHTTGFGSYTHLLPLVFIQAVLAHLIVVGGIIVSIRTGNENIFSAPEYSPGGNGKTWTHVIAHLIAGFVVAPIVGWLIGSVLLWITKKVSSKGAAAS